LLSACVLCMEMEVSVGSWWCYCAVYSSMTVGTGVRFDSCVEIAGCWSSSGGLCEVGRNYKFTSYMMCLYVSK
jgi:hypothetical protein